MYEWIKAFHVIAVISWMAGTLYLPRLFVYHCGAPAGSPQSETFKIMERRLQRGIIVPAMILTWIFGLYLAGTGGFQTSAWLWVKVALVACLTALQGFLARCVRDFAADRNRYSSRFFRIINEVPAVLMGAIVILVMVKPF